MNTHEQRAGVIDELGHYERLPLVEGGQGRTAASVTADTYLYILFMLSGAWFVTLSTGPWYLAAGLGVLVIVVATVGSIASTPVTHDKPAQGLDTHG